MKLAYTDVITFYFSFQSQTPAALIEVRSEFAKLFNRYIPTADEHGKGFDPKSPGITKEKDYSYSKKIIIFI